MADETEDTQRTVTVSDHESRIAALEKRLNELETQQLRRLGNNADGAYADAVNAQSTRLEHLEKRHENLLRYTPEAREGPTAWNAWDLLWIPVTIAMIYMVSSLVSYMVP